MSERVQHEREDVPRITVESLQDWERIKLSYVEAARKELEDSYVSSRLFSIALTLQTTPDLWKSSTNNKSLCYRE
jgi:hypothetical protein